MKSFVVTTHHVITRQTRVKANDPEIALRIVHNLYYSPRKPRNSAEVQVDLESVFVAGEALDIQRATRIYEPILTDTEQKIAHQKNADTIDHGCDGPITPFVLIMRAIELAQSGKVPASIVGNALHEKLTEYGWLSDDPDAIVETGS